tara:strand:- start:837 stop:1268 length:432 start_codon:yes stop_codon:yes gene_type:complete
MLTELIAAQCILTPPKNYGDMVVLAAEEFGIDPRILSSIVNQETKCMHSAIGSQGEVGLVQLHPGVWSDPYNLQWIKRSLGWMDLSYAQDPYQNLRAGAWILSVNLQLAGGDMHGALKLYNGASIYADKVMADHAVYWEGCEP